MQRVTSPPTKQVRPNTLTVDSARLLPRFREHAELRATQRGILRASSTDALETGRATKRVHLPAGGDPRDMRGIPVIGVPGASGAIPGSQPEQAILFAFV